MASEGARTLVASRSHRSGARVYAPAEDAMAVGEPEEIIEYRLGRTKRRSTDDVNSEYDGMLV